jgi:hypothetical protein
MGISDWFTILGLFLAIYALISTEERRILVYKLGKFNVWLILLAFTLMLCFIKYQDLYDRFEFLEKLNKYGIIHSSNWALVIFIGTVIYFAVCFYKIAEKLPSKDLINYYKTLMKQDFKVFYGLFNKYEKNATDKKHFESYKTILFEPVFIEGVSEEQYYFSDLLNSMDELTFKKYFTSILNNSNSIFYKELIRNSEYNSVQEENYFLVKIIRDNPKMFFDIGGFEILRDWQLRHLEVEKIKGSQSIYNQPIPDFINSFELSMPLYLHILFVKLLYQEAILQKIDIGSLSKSYPNMQTVFSTIIEKCIDCIDLKEYKKYKKQENPLKYHYLISEIFMMYQNWLEAFNKEEYFVLKNSLFGFFTLSLNLSINALTEGVNKKVISNDFFIRQIRFHLFNVYFKHDLKDVLRTELENVCIGKISPQNLENILTYTLDGEFGLSFGDFKNKIFAHHSAGTTEEEDTIIERLYNFMKGKNLFLTDSKNPPQQ